MQGLVACHEPPAAAVGRRIFERGGNVADVAVATAFAQIVANPFDSSLSGKVSIHVCGLGAAQGVILDAGHVIGSLAHPNSFRDVYIGRFEGVGQFLVEGHVNSVGYRSIMAFGFVPALQQLYERFGGGRLKWRELVEPAAELAEAGFDVYPKIAHYWDDDQIALPSAGWNLRQVLAAGNEAARKVFYKPGGQAYKNGERFVQADHARTLRRIAEEGPEVFYRGDIARQMADDFAQNGAFVTIEDLAEYRIEVREPIKITYKGYEVSANPPPGSGMLALMMLNIIEGFDVGRLGHNTPEYVEVVSESMRCALLARAKYRGDPKLVDVPIDMLLSKQYASDWRDRIRVGDVPAPSWGAESSSTTHVSVMDSEGNAVTMTHSHGGHAGAAIVTPGLGFLHNSHMKQFDPKPGSIDSIVPGKRQGGSVPTIVRKDGEPVIAIGGAGGTRQMTGTVQTILNVIEHGMDIHTAIAAPRFHCEQPGLLLVEAGVPEPTCRALRATGRTVQVSGRSLGRISAVYRDLHTGDLSGGAEVRNDYGRGNVGYYTDES
ncbi:MAG: gamma-glutamyltransferase [Trueperaceae bacterium]|nr:gamma-glutamyltransferase [Trueperaceae bacterium]